MSDNVEDLLKKRADLERRKERLNGKLDNARESLNEMNSQLEAMGISPSQIDQEIERLALERDAKIKEYNEALQNAEEILNRIEGRLNNL